MKLLVLVVVLALVWLALRRERPIEPDDYELALFV